MMFAEFRKDSNDDEKKYFKSDSDNIEQIRAQAKMGFCKLNVVKVFYRICWCCPL